MSKTKSRIESSPKDAPQYSASNALPTPSNSTRNIDPNPQRSQDVNPVTDGPKRSCRTCCSGRVPPIAYILVGSAIIAYIISHFWGDLIFGSKSSSSEFQDHWDGGAIEWESDGNGLSLTLINSLTNDWDSSFVAVFNDWNSAPALSLSARMKKYDTDPCGHRNQQLRVCNGDYGATGWKGLNEVVFYTAESNGKNYIVSSVATMNEYYLAGKSDVERQYVMCHEIGHGFGLDHRDEIMDNPDLGSCMDYTRNYSKNLRPDEVDFQDLSNLYGIFERNVRHLRGTSTKKLKPNLRQLLGDQNDRTNRSYGRLLEESTQRRIFEMDLGNGYKLLTVLHIDDKDADTE